MAMAAALDPYRGHQILFTIPPAERPNVSNWLADVQTFFATTAAQAADASKYFALPPSKGTAGTLLSSAQAPSTAMGYLGGVGPGATATMAPIVVGRDNFMAMEDVLEGITVHYAVQLTSALGHFLEGIRTEAARLLFGLAVIFDRKVVELRKKVERVAVGLQTDDRGYYSAVHELFHYIGPALSSMAVALVAGLECFYTCPDWTVRGICNSALARLVYENEKIFLEEDQLAAIWNLFFSLHSIPLISKVFPDRIVIIKALGLLAPLYTPAENALSYRIIDSLLRLKDKTALETDAIKSTLRKIFEKLGERTTSGAALESGNKETLGFSLFVNLINPHDEYAYDLLPWALENYSVSLLPSTAASSGKMKKIPLTDFPPLTDFIKSLANHFRATPPLVRYGACVSLHTALSVYPNMVADNKDLYVHIITGALDTDYLSAFLYVSMLEAVKAPEGRTLRDMLAALRHREREGFDYDALFAKVIQIKSKEMTISDVLDVAIKASPPLGPKTLLKMANSLEYLPKGMQLRQLELIRLWGSRTEKFDTFLMQTLVPYCNSGDEDIQMAAIKVISSLIPSFRTASPADISFAWSYFHALLDYKIKSSTLQAVLSLIKAFPLDKLADEAREELLNTLFKLVFHQEPHVRLMIYDIIGSYTDFWKASGLFGAAIGIMFLSMGDHNVDCANKVIDYLFQLSDVHFRAIVTPLGAVKDAQDGPFMHLLRTYDELANAMARDRNEMKELIDAVTLDAHVDEFWNFYLGDAPENQLVRPDDYNYARNFVHAPFWISLLLTKLGVPPPSIGEGTPRNVMPSTPAGKRRFICGFMQCLLPTCGMPDPVMRRAACVTIVRTCFKGQVLHPGMMRGLMEFVSQQMMAHKQWSFQLSALDVLKVVTRLKLPSISPCILLQYADTTLDVAYNTPSSIVKIGALELIEAFLLVFPHGVANKLQEIRDVVRALIVDTDSDVVKYASKLFPLVFRCVPGTQSADFLAYLKSEIDTLQKGGPEAKADPMIAGLSKEEKDRVLRLSIRAMGALNDPSIAYTIVQELMSFLRIREASFRSAALSSAFSQIPNLDGVRSLTIMWTLLPLYADLNESVRLIFSRYLRRVPSHLDALSKALPPHPDDSLVLPTASWEDLLTDHANFSANAKNMNDILFELDAVGPAANMDVLPAEDDGFRLPIISQRLMARLKELVKAVTGPVPTGTVNEVMYYLQELQRNRNMQGQSLLVLSEFCCLHEATLSDVVDIFSNHLSQEITPENATVIEACMLGLRNISEYSPAAFKQIINKISSPAVASEGDLIAMFYLSDLIQDICPNKAPELLRRYIPIITSQRHTIRKRLLAVYLNVEMALIAGPDEMARTLDAIQTFLDTMDEPDTRQKVYGCLGKILGHLGPKHSLFRSLLNNAKKEIRSKDPTVRLRSLDIVRILAKYMSTEEAVWFSFLYLADSNREVRNTSKEVMISEGMLDFVMSALRTFKPNLASRRMTILERCKLPSIDKVGVSIGNNANEEASIRVPFPDEDPYNVRWFSSDRRRKFSERYGMPESSYARAIQPLPNSIMAIVEEKSAAVKRPTPEALTKYQWLVNLDTITILRECIKKYPQVASDLVESILEKVEDDIAPRESARSAADESAASEVEETPGESAGGEDDEVDIEAETHRIDVLSNLLFAHDGIGDKVTGWLDRVQAFIATCTSNAQVIRESLFTNLENSFFFFNEYIDIPIVSDEQFEALEAFKAATQEATLEIVKTGKTDKFTSLEMRKNELNDLVDTRSEQLRRLTIIALHGTSGYGLFHALSTASPETRLITAFQFIADMLENEHRGIRITAVEALTTVAMIQLEGAVRQAFVNKLKTIIQDFLLRLNEDSNTLYRRKADIMNLMSQLIPYVKERTLRMQLINTLLQLWKDPDSEVRVTAIKMIQLLGESGIDEVAECFKDVDEVPTGADKLPQIMKTLASLINNPEYPDKDSLQDLLKWRFTQPFKL